MADEAKPRLLSGEIMTAAAGARQKPQPATAPSDFVEAEYETLEAHAAPASSPAQPVAPPIGGMEMLRGAGAREAARRAMRGGPVFWSVGMMFVAIAFWVSGGHSLFTRGTSSPHGTPSSVAIGDVRSRLAMGGGREMLFIDGVAYNRGADAARLPPIDIRVTGGDGRLTVYKLGTGEQVLAPGGRYTFSSRLEAPKEGVKTVLVAFRESRDAGRPGQEH
jgi:hypothetical protein